LSKGTLILLPSLGSMGPFLPYPQANSEDYNRRNGLWQTGAGGGNVEAGGMWYNLPATFR
jgi:hypothetical protein